MCIKVIVKIVLAVSTNSISKEDVRFHSNVIFPYLVIFVYIRKGKSLSEREYYRDFANVLQCFRSCERCSAKLIVAFIF